MRSGFVAIVGRPNVGKSTLLNAMVGTKVSITAPRPNTTRFTVRGVVHAPGAQAVVVDTPGLHKPRSELGTRLNATALEALHDVEAVVAVLDATAPVGPGDRIVLERAAGSLGAGGRLLVAVNKQDRARPRQVLDRLAEAAQAVEALDAELSGRADYFPVSARTGIGVGALVDALLEGLPEGPPYYPAGTVSDLPQAVAVAELVREQLLATARDELPHSIACVVTEWEWPRVRCEILVERESQKPIVIGRSGERLKEVGSAVRAQLDPGVYLELFVRVERDWQRRRDALDRLGY